MTNENLMFEYRIGGGEVKLSERERKSIEILRALNDGGYFNRVGENVCFYTYENGSLFRKVSIEDYFKAVDFYYKNRESEVSVNYKMTKPDGFVNIYSPARPEDVSERVIVLSLKNYLVPQMLEFGYKLARRELKKLRWVREIN